MINTDFMKGVIVPILTPIDENEWIDEIKMREQVDFVINGGVSGILAFGSNGEFYVIEEDEMERGLKIIVQKNVCDWLKWQLHAGQQVFLFYSQCS